ncbi:radical SAM protein [Desulfonema ishimotonii]|uniref:Radical SAM protein n=1 Tax=Desulfonema ishimotonii TaxID=45657 RepID=A0A401FVX7_9BACT|nr:radical SAM protein [Desulfonema ishimotonii]GBC61103.1 radical SAM protein [Desulfonema ishimotonii]
MASSQNSSETYSGFEQGPIRPPSEANSLLIRVTRNCPWNKCTFCPVYKGKTFSRRPVAHVKQDIDAVHRYVEMLQGETGASDRISHLVVRDIAARVSPEDEAAFYASVNWFSGGLRSVFIQDANSLIVKPEALVEILTHLRKRFPWADRITSYARSHTIARISDGDLKSISDAGLNRIHIGLESGSDAVLKKVRKGATKALHIKAGVKVKAAGMELSEYVMPGLGGQELSEIHARETADALSQINPDYIRLRTLAIPGRAPLSEAYQSGAFRKCTDLMMAKEILLFIQSLDGITGTLTSDHILNLFQEVEGVFPHDREKMTQILSAFLEMPPARQCLYQVGRRLGIFHGLSDMDSPQRVRKVERVCRENGITPENADEVVDALMKRFI